MSKHLFHSDFQFPKQTHAYHGKVRDMYTMLGDRIVAVVSDRISAFDVVLPEPIPFKGQVLNGIASSTPCAFDGFTSFTRASRSRAFGSKTDARKA